MDNETKKNQQKAINGFIAWILTIVGLVIYFVWMVFPENVLRVIHFRYYPDKYWGLAIPGIVIMGFTFYWTTYMTMYLRNTNPLTSILTVADVDSGKPKGGASSGVKRDDSSQRVKGLGSGLSGQNSSKMPPIEDIPVNVSSMILHQPWRK